MKMPKFKLQIFTLCAILSASIAPGVAFSEDGVSDTEIVIGGVMDLKGPARNLGQAIKAGIEAALKDELVGDRSVRFIARNDDYLPSNTVEETRKLVNEKVFAMAGTVGTTMAKRTLPILEESGVPAIGYYSGADFLREGAKDVINYRASFSQEIKAVVEAAIDQGVSPDNICGFVRNDDYGMAAVKGIAQALDPYDEMAEVVTILEKMLALGGMQANRNRIGPVGTYARGALSAREGYDSLKLWEKRQNITCRFVVTIGTYDAIARFVAYAVRKEEPWAFTALSFTGADKLASTLAEFGVFDRVIMTQVVPVVSENNPSLAPSIAIQAKEVLGEQYNTVSQEGYIVGKMILHGLRKVEAQGKELTRKNFVDAFIGKTIFIDGLTLDFTDDNQGTDMVEITGLSNGKWILMEGDKPWASLLTHLDHSKTQHQNWTEQQELDKGKPQGERDKDAEKHAAMQMNNSTQ